MGSRLLSLISRIFRSKASDLKCAICATGNDHFRSGFDGGLRFNFGSWGHRDCDYGALFRIVKLMGGDKARMVLLDHAALRPGYRVLEIGCGTGTLATLIKRLHPDVEVVGIDFSTTCEHQGFILPYRFVSRLWRVRSRQRRASPRDWP